MVAPSCVTPGGTWALSEPLARRSEVGARSPASEGGAGQVHCVQIRKAREQCRGWEGQVWGLG